MECIRIGKEKSLNFRSMIIVMLCTIFVKRLCFGNNNHIHNNNYNSNNNYNKNHHYFPGLWITTEKVNDIHDN